MGVPPGNSTFRFQKCQKTQPVTHKFELPSATSQILAICKNPNHCGLENAKPQEVIQPTSAQIDLKTNHKKSYNQPVRKSTSKPMMQTSTKYIDVNICVYFIHTCAFAFWIALCTHVRTHAHSHSWPSPDAIEVGCTVPTSGYHRPSAPLGNLSDENESAQNNNYKTGCSS